MRLRRSYSLDFSGDKGIDLSQPKHLGKDLLIVTAFGLITVFLWGQTLNSSLWLDETLTYWVSSGSFSEMRERVFQFQGQGWIYYALPWCLIQLGVTSEIAIRLISLVSLLAVLPLALSIFRRYLSEFGALIGLLVLLLSEASFFAATSARPYSLALLFGVLSLQLLLQYYKSNDFVALLLSALNLGLSILTHYFFVGLLFAGLLITIIEKGSDQRKKVFALAMLGITSLVVLFISKDHIAYLLERSTEISFPGRPTILELVLILLNGSVVFLFLISYIIASTVKGDRSNSLPTAVLRSMMIVSFIWYLVPTLLLFALAYTLGSVTLFSERYLLPHLLSLPLLLGAISERLPLGRSRSLMIVIFGAFVLMGNSVREYPKEDWRGAVSNLKEKSNGRPTIFFPGLVESGSLTFLEEQRNKGYLSAPLFYYGFNQDIELAPLNIESENLRHYWEKLLAKVTASEKGFLFVFNDSVLLLGSRASSYFTQKLKERGIESTGCTGFRGVKICEFR